MSQPEFIPVKIGESRINVEDEIILDNIQINIRRPLPQAWIMRSTARRAVLVAGGPSLQDQVDNIRKYAWKGTPIFAMNGSGGFLINLGIKPYAMVLCDAREINMTFFVEGPIPGCRYYVASHCSPKIFDLLESSDADLWIYHTAPIDPATKIFDDYYGEVSLQVNGGNTVGLCTIALARMLGYPMLSLFGYDSCCRSKNIKHAYKQDIDKDDRIMKVKVGEKEFLCTAWQMRQAQNFYNMIKHYGQYFSLRMYGEGLLSHILETGKGINLEAKEA